MASRRARGEGRRVSVMDVVTSVLMVLLCGAIVAAAVLFHDKTNQPRREARPISTSAVGRGDLDNPPGAVAVTTLLAGRDARNVWSGRVGTCTGGGARLSLSHDGGRSWDKVPLPRDVKVVSGIDVTGPESARLVVATRSCDPELIETPDAGQSWSSPKRARDVWARTPKASSDVVDLDGQANEACRDEVVDLGSDPAAGAVALCGDGQVVTTATGKSWSIRNQMPAAVAVSRTEEKVFAAQTSQSPCSGVLVVEVARAGVAAPSSSTPTSPGEVPSKDERPVHRCVSTQRAVPGTVALSVNDTGGWLASGTQLFRAGPKLDYWQLSGQIPGTSAAAPARGHE